MLCYKDQTFCNSDCINTKCFRYLSNDEEYRAEVLGLPIAFGNLAPTCDEYTPPTDDYS